LRIGSILSVAIAGQDKARSIYDGRYSEEKRLREGNMNAKVLVERGAGSDFYGEPGEMLGKPH